MIVKQVNGCYLVRNREYKNEVFWKFFDFLNAPHFLTIWPRPKKLKEELSDWKVMMIVALWKKQIIAFETLRPQIKVDWSVYLNFLEHRLLPEVEKKKFGRPIILHDNARPHIHRAVREFFQAKRWEVLEHPPYSPDMSPPDMDGIARIKAPNKGKHFLTQEELIEDYRMTIQDINKKHESKGIDMLPDRWRAITLKHGDYLD